MKIIVQRVKEASVSNGSIDNKINKGYCLFVEWVNHLQKLILIH